MASLVADYGTSSSSSEYNSDLNSSENESDSDADVNETGDDNEKPSDGRRSNNSNSLIKLPKPNFGDNVATTKTSIFSNPFKDEENAEKAILEKHVKMVNSHANAKVLNGKKICWNYRKGRCRFGTKCTFAHDSDLQKSDAEISDEMKMQQTVMYEHQPLQQGFATVPPKTTAIFTADEPPKKKKRPGLTSGLVPGKKVIKNYKKMQTKST